MNKIYSIIDIETTGGIKNAGKITEIAIINFDGKKIIDSFTTLINPERNIPQFITKLTGIDNSMTDDAPKFYEVAKKIVEMTEGNIFVAHNVFFDFNFIKHEFDELGFSFKREKLCTVRLARKFLKGHKSYSLGKLCNDLGIEISARHRAYGDARATVELFKLILAKGELGEEEYSKKHKQTLPDNLENSEFEKLSHKAGVYYFYDSQGELIYIGKSVDIKKRVSSHFRPDMKRRKDIELKSKISKIDSKVLGNELASLLFEAHEIKTHSPKYNRSLKRLKFPVACYFKENKDGVLSLELTHNNVHEDYLFTFASKRTGASKINSIYNSFLGTEKDSLFFEKLRDKLISTIGIDAYNKLLIKSANAKIVNKSDYYLKLKGRIRGESCIIVVEDNYPVEIKYHNNDSDFESIKLIRHQDLKNILNNYVVKHKLKVYASSESSRL